MIRKAYPKYKPSGVEWLRDVPEHWGVKKLKYCLSLRTGKAKTDSNPIALENIESWTGRFIATESEFEGDGIAFDSGDILFGKLRPYLAKVYLAGKSGESIGDIFVLKPAQNVVPRFGAECLRTKNYIEIIDGSTYGSKMPRANWEFMGSLPFLLPPMLEQQAIAAFLDHETTRIDSLISKKQQLLKLLAEQRSALISRAVTKGLDVKVKMKPSGVEWLGDVPEHWDVLPLRRIVQTVKTGGTPTGAEDSAFADDGFNWYSPSDFNDKVFLGKSNRALSNEGKLEVRIFPAGTVMLIGIGATIGKVGLAINTSACNQQINGIICGKRLDPVFATYYLKTMRDFIVKCGKYTTLPIINQEETKNLIFTVPPLSEQQAITALLNRDTAKIDVLSEKVVKVIERLKEYRTSLISSAVTGKIDVRESV